MSSGKLDHDVVESKIVDGEVAARGVEVGLVRMRSILIGALGAGSTGSRDGLDEFESAAGDVPYIDGTVTVGGTNKTGVVLVEAEVDDTGAASGGDRLGQGGRAILAVAALEVEDAKVIAVLVDCVQLVGLDELDPRRSTSDVGLEGDIKLGAVVVGEEDVASSGHENL
ncbi:unnamed protein product [Clonostachys chloroleuca]|uniref:Uncharacterized protein n=1 Tax=Clonostachys chloroleuca TaxID=1926264 RepID=A0AA35M9Y2_9HYPO|nr:unnamed protein product [Clonostachys chloroleuca]